MSPLYDYKCGCGNEFDALRSIEDRHSVVCACGRVADLKVSSSARTLMATPFTVVGSDGRVIHQTQTTEKTPPPGYRYGNPNLVEA